MGGIVYATSHGTLYAIGSRLPPLGVTDTASVIEATALRGTPSPTGSERAWLEVGTVVTITGEAVTTGVAVWWPVSVEGTGSQGWVEATALSPLSSGPPASTPTA